MASAPSWGAGTGTKEPLNWIVSVLLFQKGARYLTFPVGVRAALRIYASRISPFALVVALKCRLTWATRCNGRLDAAGLSIGLLALGKM